MLLRKKSGLQRPRMLIKCPRTDGRNLCRGRAANPAKSATEASDQVPVAVRLLGELGGVHFSAPGGVSLSSDSDSTRTEHDVQVGVYRIATNSTHWPQRHDTVG